MSSLKRQKRGWLIALLCLTIMTLAVGCTSQVSNIKTTDEALQPGAGEALSCLTAMEAMNSVGQTACVEFYVGNASQYKGDVFLNEMADYKKGFGATILADSTAKFEDPLNRYKYKTIRVTGQIVIHDGHPGIIINDPVDISIIK
jgi:7,8-dihydro-6-hydroxymethylpterin-pyrophosphokinase